MKTSHELLTPNATRQLRRRGHTPTFPLTLSFLFFKIKWDMVVERDRGTGGREEGGGRSAPSVSVNALCTTFNEIIKRRAGKIFAFQMGRLRADTRGSKVQDF